MYSGFSSKNWLHYWSTWLFVLKWPERDLTWSWLLCCSLSSGIVIQWGYKGTEGEQPDQACQFPALLSCGLQQYALYTEHAVLPWWWKHELVVLASDSFQVRNLYQHRHGCIAIITNDRKHDGLFLRKAHMWVQDHPVIIPLAEIRVSIRRKPNN